MLFMMSCTKMDHYYKDYIIERKYVGKPDSVWVETGDNKVRIGIRTPKDAEAKQIIVKWDGDSAKFAINHNIAQQYFVIDNVSEGSHVFNINTSDDKGLYSVPMELSTTVYGELFKSTLNARELSHSIKFTDSVRLIWKNMASEIVEGTEVAYTSKSGEATKVLTDFSNTVDMIKDVDLTKPITYRTAYKPSENSYEYFYTAEEVLDLEATKKNKLTLVSSAYTNAEFIDFNNVQVYLEAEVNDALKKTIDLCYTLGSGSRSNFMTINGTGFGAFAAAWQTNIDLWSTRNAGLMKLDRSTDRLTKYENLDELDRNSMVNAYNNAMPAALNRVSALLVDDIIYLNSSTRGIYVAMKVLAVPPPTAGAYGPIEVEFKVSRP